MEYATKIETRILHEEVAKQIQKLIASGRLAKGQKIDERSLAESMGVSRTPIREALRILSSRGLIDLVPYKGAFVAQFGSQELRDMFEIMSVLEGMCARLAVRNMTDEDLSKIEGLHDRLEAAYVERDHKTYLETNSLYHLLVQKLSRNTEIDGVANVLRDKIGLYRQKQLYKPERFDASIHEHREVLEAFRNRDAPLAEESMKKHLMQQCYALISVIDE